MSKPTIKTFVCFIVIWSLASLTYAVTPNGNAHGLLKAKLDAYFQQLEVEENFCGSVLVAKEGRVLLQTGYGMADYEKVIPNKANTVHAIASLTKGFTAMSILMLAERGWLSLDDPVSIYLPQVPNSDNIKIYHLLSHTSGLFEKQMKRNEKGTVKNLDKKEVIKNADIWNTINKQFGNMP